MYVYHTQNHAHTLQPSLKHDTLHGLITSAKSPKKHYITIIYKCMLLANPFNSVLIVFISGVIAVLSIYN